MHRETFIAKLLDTMAFGGVSGGAARGHGQPLGVNQIMI
jgi:hypothetical protein